MDCPYQGTVAIASQVVFIVAVEWWMVSMSFTFRTYYWMTDEGRRVEVPFHELKTMKAAGLLLYALASLKLPFLAGSFCALDATRRISLCFGQDITNCAGNQSHPIRATCMTIIAFTVRAKASVRNDFSVSVCE